MKFPSMDRLSFIMEWREITVEISTDKYKVAPLDKGAEAVAIIKEAEESLKRMTGEKITLIAYEETEKEYK